jgi:RimJ/RimL family protein N-acetyltransferase
MMFEKELFLKGYTIGLRPPNEDDMLKSGWHTWYNKIDTTRYNSHGVYPVSIEQELEIIKNTLNRNDSILLAIHDLKSEKILGNVCLQNIDHFNRRANLAMTIGEPSSMSAGIEAYGLMTHHAFMKLNLERIEDGTHEKALNFIKMISIFGYSIDGISKRYFLKDDKWSNKINFSIIREDYLKFIAENGGNVLLKDQATLQKAIVKSLKP